MSSGDLTASRSSSPRTSVTGRLQSQESMDPAQIPLPPSEAGSIQENEVRDTVISLNAGTEADLDLQSMNIPEAVPFSARLGEFWDAMGGKEYVFLRRAAEHDPYIPNPRPIPTEPTENVDEGKKPTRTESWERMLKEVSRHDEDMVKGWRDDIDTLLVFAGLFSAVVTAFVIKSYQWLVEDPADTTVTLLTHLIAVQVNGSQSASFEPTQFKADPSSIRINVFWFLSLILSLTSALFGLLCKQWVREHQRDTTTRTPGEALALRQLRRDSFDKWGVSSFLSALPILLEAALLFFFVGVLDLLWNRHHVPFAVCFVAISFSAGLYFLTALLPTLMVPRDQTDDIIYQRFNQLSYQFICPYKSPQAWLVYRLSSIILRPLFKIPAISDFFHEKTRGLWDHVTSPAQDWSSFDLWVVRQFDQQIWLPINKGNFNLKVYELRAFEWAVTMFRDSPSMIPHLQNVLETNPPSVAVSAVLDRWDCMVRNTVSMEDVENVLRDPYSPLWEPTIRHPVLQQPEGINLLFHQQYWVNLAAQPFLHYNLNLLIGSMKNADLQHSTGLRFVIPFSVVDALWTHEDLTVRAKSLTLLSLFEESWKPRSGYDEERHDDERRAFMQALADHINRKDRVSALLTSKHGQAFIRFIHNEAITRRFVYRDFDGDLYGLGGIWSQAIKRAQEDGNLPSDYFAPIPGYEDPLPTLPNLDAIRYSVETQRDSQVDDSEVLNIVTLNEHGDAIGADPPEGLIRRLHNFGAWLVARRWLSFFLGSEKATHNNVNDNAIPGGRIADSPDEMIEIASRESGEGHEGNAQHLGRDDSMKDLGPRQQTDTGIVGNSSGQGDKVADIGGDSYGPRRQGSRADIMGQPTHDQEDVDEDNRHRLGADTGTLGDRDEVEVHGDSYRLQSLGRQVSGSSNHREDAE
ncbi:hypothetical protein Moror_5015 [Moniliophthora roreri MCA 2997]|uniref:DUF6535 domain-containing protein n=1 Tax=Moniliophthora roreri (strain MCA 2997) TaxID=1381753 RepID=V2WHM3_MONRO|nr:hypothetical protein Moror_5015 [Moniliophthora roreri MCA 2997]